MKAKESGLDCRICAIFARQRFVRRAGVWAVATSGLVFYVGLCFGGGGLFFFFFITLKPRVE